MKIIVPETADLQRVLRVLEAIQGGVSPHDSSGLSVRQASYAVQTATALNLVTRNEGAYQLTPAGRSFVAVPYGSSASIRLLRQAVSEMDLVRHVVPELLSVDLSSAELAERLQTHPAVQLAEATAQKRAVALRSWRAQLDEQAAPQNVTDRTLLIQLSDIHFSEHAASNPVVARVEAIAHCVAGHFEMMRPQACMVAVTGDVAQTGAPAEYEVALRFLRELRDTLAKRLQVPVHIVLVPGNHDCDFRSETSVRRKLLETLSLDDLDSDLVREGASVQASFNALAAKLESFTATHFDDLGMTVCTTRIGPRTIRFDKYNTAWCSRRDEKQGTLLFPIPRLGPTVPDCDAVIAMFHHSLDWLSAENGRQLREHLDGTADVVLTGHNHVGGRYRRVRESGEQTEHIEGLVLQDRADASNSGFAALLIDFGRATQESIFFRWSEDNAQYELSERFPERAFLRTKLRSRSLFPITTTFGGWLTDPGDAHTHPKKKHLQLEDIFVYPELRPTFVSEATAQQTRRIIKDPLLHVLKERRVFILGSEFSGKTCLARKLFVDLRDEGLVPLYLSGRDIRDVTEHSLQACRDDAIRSIYGSATHERFLQTEPEKRVLIIDDAQQSSLAPDQLNRAVDIITTGFAYAVVLGDDDLPLRILNAAGGDGGGLLSFEMSAIEPFGAARRYRLIERWCYLGRAAHEDRDQLSRRAQLLDELMSRAVSTSLLPTYPGLLLLCLQQIEAARGTQVADGSFGHLYDALITRNLWVDGKSQIDIGAKRKVLALFAFQLFESGTDSLPRADWDELFDGYREEHDAHYNTRQFYSELLDSGLVAEIDGEVCFRYKYAYCYFVATHLVESGPENMKQHATDLARHLHHDDDANILLFMAHLDRHSIVYEVLIERGKSLLPHVVDFDLHAQLRPLGDSQHIRRLTLNGASPEERRVAEREQRDSITRGEEESTGPLPDELLNLVRAFRTIHLLGQVLKGKTGTMVADQKSAVLKQCYDLGLRTIAAFVVKVVEKHADMAVDLAKLLVQHLPELESDLAEVKTRVRAMLISLCEGLVYATAMHVSHSVGAASLVRTYDRVLKERDGEVLFRLFDLAIRLDHTPTFPKDQLAALDSRLHGRPSPANVLRRLIWRHLCLFPVDRKVKQALCAKYDIKEQRVSIERRLSGADK